MRGVLIGSCDVFGMDVVDRIAQRAHGQKGIDVLPEKMAGIEIRTDFWTDRITQPQQCFGIVNDKSGVPFQGNHVHAVVAAELHFFLPIRENFLIPLPIQNAQEIGRPGQVTQFGYKLLSLSPGQPENVTTRRTPIFSATNTDWRNSWR